MAIFEKVSKLFGGGNGKLKAEKAKVEKQISAWETERANLIRERDKLQADLAAKIERARKLDASSREYQELKHEAMVIKPQLDMLDGHVNRLLNNIEKYHKVLTVYRTSELTSQTQVDEPTLTKISVMVEDISNAVEAASDLDQELEEVTKKTDQIHQRMAAQSFSAQDSFFDELVKGPSAAPAEEEDPFAQMVAEANAKETASAAAEAPEAPPAQPAEPVM